MNSINGLTYGVTFGDKHSIKDWNIYLKSRPTISPPDPKTAYADVPGFDGSIDLTESASGRVSYNNRKLQCEFVVMDGRERWPTIYSTILNYLHGQLMKVIFDEDPSYYYEGRFEVDKWQSNRFNSTIVITGNVKPYKMEITDSTEKWLWDPFNFETGIIREYADLIVDGTLQVTVLGSRLISVPLITTSNVMTVKFNGQIYNLVKGENEIPEIQIEDGENILIFEGSGTVSIKYRGGSL